MSVQDIMKDFWKKYGRSFFLRYGISPFIFASRELCQGTIFFFSILTDNRLITLVSLTDSIVLFLFSKRDTKSLTCS